MQGHDGVTHSKYIFNALHNSMRQFGSVLQHNGMSYMLATVPEDTEFYHGSSSSEPVEGMQWLAFEPEHAMAFARPRRFGSRRVQNAFDAPALEKEKQTRWRFWRSWWSNKEVDIARVNNEGRICEGKKGDLRPQKKHKHPEKQAHIEHKYYDFQNDRKDRQHDNANRSDEHGNHRIKRHQDGKHLSSKEDRSVNGPTVNRDGTESSEGENYGYLHTYRTKHPLRLLYLDGQSAAKSTKGPLDTQDIVLRNASQFSGSPIEGDPLRGEDLCAVAKDDWDNKIDGSLRMVGGFEIVLCSFNDHLDVVNIAAKESRGVNKDETGLSYAQALATRAQGIGGERVSIDYEKDFLTAFAFPEAVYINDDGLPRIQNDSEKLSKLRRHIHHLVVEHRLSIGAVDWQAVMDMIVGRYSYRIEHMLSDFITTINDLRRQAHLALEPFIDDANRNDTLEVARRSAQFWPSKADSTTVPAQAVRIVSNRICKDLVSVMNAENYSEGITIIQELRDNLDWTSFKERECAKCDVDQVCQLPIWPSGSKQDFDQPRCGGAMSHGAGGYWDMMGEKRRNH